MDADSTSQMVSYIDNKIRFEVDIKLTDRLTSNNTRDMVNIHLNVGTDWLTSLYTVNVQRDGLERERLSITAKSSFEAG